MDFLRRHSFWVVVGGLLVVALVVYLLGVRRLASENARLSRDLANTDKQVKELSASVQLPSEGWVKAAEQYEAELKGEYQKALDLIQSRAVDRYKTLPKIDPADCVSRRDKEGNEYQLPTGAVFKTRYPEAVAELETRLQDARIPARADAVRLPFLAGAIPDDAVILNYQSRYWLMSDLVDALVASRVPIDDLLLLTEEATTEAGMFGPPGGEGMMGGEPTVSVSSSEDIFDFRRMLGGEGEGGGAPGGLQRFVTGNVGVTTAMQELFFQSQRRVRLVAQMDSRELPVLIQALTNMPRLTVVRTVDAYRATLYGEAALKPVVRVDIRALCFDRYSRFAPTEVARQ